MYLAAVSYDLWFPSLYPTDDELRMLSVYIDASRDWFNEGWQARLRERPFDVDGGHNTTTFVKRGDGDWCYRQRTWTTGPFVFPPPAEAQYWKGVTGPWTLAECMDNRATIAGSMSGRWVARRNEHPDLFPPLPADVETF